MTMARTPIRLSPRLFCPGLLVLGLLALLAAPLAAAVPPTADEAAEAYVQGRMALADDDLPLAAERFGLALKSGPDEELKRRALDVALMGGDMKLAVELASSIRLEADSTPGRGMADSIVALTRVAAAAQARDWKAYEAARIAFSAPGRGGESGQIIATLVEAYGRAGRGDTSGALGYVDRAVIAISPAGQKGLTASYFAEHRAHLLALGKRWPEAADAYAAIVAAEGANVARLRIMAAAAALEASRSDPSYRARAITLLGGGAEQDPMLVEARARLSADPKMDGRALGYLPERVSDGLGLLFLRVATDLGRERANGPSLSLARLATLAAPAMPDGWLVTADILARGGKTELALQALDHMPKSAPWAEMTDSRRAAVLAGAERYDEARALLTQATNRPDSGMDDWARLADLERRAGRNAEAADAYTRALALQKPPGSPVEAQLMFLRGSARELAGNWTQAEGDLRRAVELQPDNALFLNYLGYSLLDRGRQMAEAKALIARAYKAAPDNGAIIDSMGWAEYLSGNFAEAVQLLEKARAAEPSDPTVSDHLGDALWKAGRKIEARHAWNSAAALSPEPKLAALLAKKLDFGLDLALASR